MNELMNSLDTALFTLVKEVQWYKGTNALFYAGETAPLTKGLINFIDEGYDRTNCLSDLPWGTL